MHVLVHNASAPCTANLASVADNFCELAMVRMAFHAEYPQKVAAVRTGTPASTVAKLVIDGKAYCGRNTWAGSDVTLAQTFKDNGFVNPTDPEKIASNVCRTEL